MGRREIFVKEKGKPENKNMVETLLNFPKLFTHKTGGKKKR